MFVRLRWCEHAPGPPRPGASPWWRLVLALAALLVAALPVAGAAEPVPRPGNLEEAEPASPTGFSLPPVPLAYRVELTLEPGTGEFRGRETIRWQRPGSAPIRAIPLHLYLNAFSNQETTWMRESGGFARDLPARLEDEDWGFVRLDRVVRLPADGGGTGGGTPLEHRFVRPDDGNPFDTSLAEVVLDRPLAAGETLVLEIEFSGKFPRIIARTGCTAGFCLGGQWYPKLGVYELPGTRGATAERWVAHQFHGPTEFYAEFADYDVTLDVPAGTTVAATGVATPAAEPAAPGRERHRFVQRAVHDFAFVASPGLEILERDHVPPGRTAPVRLRCAFPAGAANRRQAERALDAAVGAMDVLGRAIGPYPYDVLTIVLPPWQGRFAVGMEYPTFITGLVADPILETGLLAGVRLPEITVLHEFAHQYFYGMVATCEQEDAFLDEGFTQYWEGRATRELYGRQTSGGSFLGRPVDVLDRGRLQLAGQRDEIRDPVLRRPSWLYWPGTGNTGIYTRTRLLLDTIDRRFGTKTVDAIFRAYFARWRFRHPGPADFLAVAREVGGDEIADLVLEEWTSPRVADYRVEDVEVKRWNPPRGRAFLPGGEEAPASLAGEKDEMDRVAALPPVAERWLERDGNLHVRVSDPGYAEPDGTVVPGGRRWTAVPLDVARAAGVPGAPGGDGAADDDPRPWRSVVRITGPGRRHLPVRVRLVFEDGAVFEETWDGRAPWREYLAIRPARLERIEIDPGGELALDAGPFGNGRLREPPTAPVRDWRAWFGALAAWLAAGVTSWL